MLTRSRPSSQSSDVLSSPPISPIIGVAVPLFSPLDPNPATAPVTGGMSCAIKLASLLKVVELATESEVEVVITSPPSNVNVDLESYNIRGLDPNTYTFRLRAGTVEPVGFGADLRSGRALGSQTASSRRHGRNCCRHVVSSHRVIACSSFKPSGVFA